MDTEEIIIVIILVLSITLGALVVFWAYAIGHKPLLILFSIVTTLNILIYSKELKESEKLK